MSVRFFPEKNLESLRETIVKEDGQPLNGEIDMYLLIHNSLRDSSDEWYVWHDLKLPFHSEISNPAKKVSSQIDFLILSKYGILVLETKGGAISFKDNSFFYGKNFEKISQDPFRQVEGYKFTIKDKILSNFRGVFFCEAVAFPHVDYPFFDSTVKIFDEKILWTKYSSLKKGLSFEDFIKNVFNFSKKNHSKYNRFYSEIKKNEVEKIKNILSPYVADNNIFSSISTLEWLQIKNLEILDGLQKNPRVMLEGPPGSGKTTLAKAFIDQHKDKKGLYICWNNLLMSFTNHFLNKRLDENTLEVTTLFKLIIKLNSDLRYDDLIKCNEDGFYELVDKTIKKLKSNNHMPNYDYIIIDEGQDLFDRGVDLIVENFCGTSGRGLSNGQLLVLYDLNQAYLSNNRNISLIADLLSESFAHFKLNDVKRSAQSPSIRKLSQEILNYDFGLNRSNKSKIFPDLQIMFFKLLENAKTYIAKNILTLLRDNNSSLRGEDCVLLVESVLLKESFYEEPGMNYWLTMKDVEELNTENINETSGKLRYTSILKYKGLEKLNVFLVVTPTNLINRYEHYVGITRAISNLTIMIIDSES